jgi:hypothetical protein
MKIGSITHEELAPAPLDKFMTEKEFNRNVCQFAKLKGYEVYHTFNSFHSDPGFPDLTMAKEDRLIFAELKTERGKISKSQTKWLNVLSSTGKCEVFTWKPSEWIEVVAVLS